MKSILCLLFFLIGFTSSAQLHQLIAVQNGNTPSFYTSLDSAILNAQNDDTLFLPGGYFPVTVAVDKRIHFVGVGCEIDSNMATGKTEIQGDIILQNNAGGGTVLGCAITGSISTGENISNFKVWRCSFSSLVMQGNNNNWLLYENAINGEFRLLQGVTDIYFHNNIIIGYMGWQSYGFNTSVFKNNIFLSDQYRGGYSGAYLLSADNGIFENNIFISIYPTQTISRSVFNNNLFVASDPFDYCSECRGANNIFGQDKSSIFVDLQAGDYHIQETSPGKTGGKNGTPEGTEVGIYSGLYPWKEGALPPNPHFELIDVAPKTNIEGNLNVQIKVAAQER